LKTELSRYLRRVKGGEVVMVTDRGKNVALVTPVQGGVESKKEVWGLVSSGVALWAGSKPAGLREPVKIKGKALSQIILEQRR